MGAPSVGDVVLVRFPFSDLSASKLRPAVVVARAERSEVIVCQITSRPYASQRAVTLAIDDFSSGNLDRFSYARADKLFTANPTIIVRTVGTLGGSKSSEIRAAVANLFS